MKQTKEHTCRICYYCCCCTCTHVPRREVEADRGRPLPFFVEVAEMGVGGARSLESLFKRDDRRGVHSSASLMMAFAAVASAAVVVVVMEVFLQVISRKSLVMQRQHHTALEGISTSTTSYTRTVDLAFTIRRVQASTQRK